MRIEEYALLGNFLSAALVSRDGSIDWLCFPRFDSPACFAALLGTEDNGRWLVRPREFTSVKRRYREGTLILETEYETAEGTVRVTDAMIPYQPTPTLIRIVEGLTGNVPMSMELVIRFDYGSIVPWVTRDVFGGLKAIAGPDTVRLKTTADMFGEDLKTYANFTVGPGEAVPFVMTWSPSHADSPREVEDPMEVVDRTADFWLQWIGHCTYTGPWKDAVHRSLITLKALTFAQTGGMVAAVTTSLPEHLGGIRNWDYRYCWIRDSTFTLFALLTAGYREEARHWQEWLLRAVAGTPSQVNIMYGLRGERRLTEIELPWLNGYEDSRPVRIGNAAYSQVQMDVFGELLSSFHLGRSSGLQPMKSWRVESRLVDFIAQNWQQPDNGIWEVRGPRQHFTHSKVMAWVALNRAIQAVEKFGQEGPVEQWKKLARQIHAEVCKRGFDRKLGSFVQAYGSETVDASLLMLAMVGFLPASDPRIIGTVAAVQRELTRDGFVYRYLVDKTDDGLTGGEGAFLACSFWLADNLFLQERRAEAEEIFERVLAVRNDVGLLAEEYDPGLGRLLGNFPQAFSHVSLVNTAFNLSESDAGWTELGLEPEEH